MIGRHLLNIFTASLAVTLVNCSDRKLPDAGAEMVAAETVSAQRQVAQAKPSILPKIRQDKLEACYENFLKTKPLVDEGTLVVRWDLNSKGQVSTTKVVESELKDKKFTNCVIESLKQAHFPEAATYPKSVAHKYNFKRRSPASL